ncbi:hypothetical protein [Opitutus sp. ER46]|uniref:hypothetical protein n=1 Tax=Opitutus sp. ER46 TaxID=2161864 RepID=UPI000D30BDF7|nr:hypothetical protein [Opitutus sp. ER46]PTX96535.1 hypothetical protein DB354_07715 [Opitutus sp. ER46]
MGSAVQRNSGRGGVKTCTSSVSQTDLSRFYPSAPRRLPPELAGVTWPPPDATVESPATA